MRSSCVSYFEKNISTQKKYGQMTPKLILIGGEAWTGKSTCAELLFRRLDNSAWLDGDDVWRVNPWSLDDPRLRTSDVNMAFVLQTYLKAKFAYVILSSIVLCDAAITRRILGMVEGVSYEVLSFTLFADEKTLRSRAWERDETADPEFMLLRQAAERDTIQVDTSGRTPGEIVSELERLVRHSAAQGLQKVNRDGITEWKIPTRESAQGSVS